MKPEKPPAPGVTWEQRLVRTEQLVDDNAPDPKPNRATRRAMKRAALTPTDDQTKEQ